MTQKHLPKKKNFSLFYLVFFFTFFISHKNYAQVDRKAAIIAKYNSDHKTALNTSTSPGISKKACTFGPGTGTTALGCPNVLVGGLGLGTADPAPITCATGGCTTLEASYLKLGQTTTYTVASIPYAPPYQYNCLRNPVSVSTDDVWSPAINMPFNFCFYGNTYSKCYIGSNGILTFTNPALSSSVCEWDFSNVPYVSGLPVAGHQALRENSIFGVFHDMNPGITGSEVGWELITLNTGCRALVASWSNVGMYLSDNVNTYTGMMVLYENTNVIEIYVKQKKITSYEDSPGVFWNHGKAIIGLQNAAGTAAVVVPGKNGLDPSWTATNEAWRFTPAGPAITSVKWYAGNTATGPVLATTDTYNVCPTATSTYTAEVTYALCGGSTLKVNDQTTVTVSPTKTWNGATSTDWNTASNWTPAGVPTSTTAVIIPNTTAINKPIVTGAMVACNITVQNGGLLTVASANSLKVDNSVNVNTGGTFIVKDNASLVQINDSSVNTVTGTFTYERTAKNYAGTAGVLGSDYVYWSSPVANQDISTIYTVPTQGPKYVWNTTAANANGGLGNWGAASGIMTPAKGYIVRGSSTYAMPATYINATFTGTPNNGIITMKAPRGAMVPANVGAGLTYPNPALNAWNDNWSLLGNPYPSAINGLQFLSSNSTDLVGTVRLWRHLSTPAAIASPFYQSYQYNYNSGDYLSINWTGPTVPAATDIIKTGQAFMVQRIEGASDVTGVNVTFNNAMRTNGGTILSNSGFFKNSNYANNTNDIEKNRIWLDIVDDTNKSSETTLIGYVDGATMGWDNKFDATIGTTADIGIYTFTDNEKCIIQGRPTPFDINDTVPVGINVHTNGNYHIALKAVDGLFSNNGQTIYLEDKQLDLIHNLSQAPYSFTSDAGTKNDRFVLRYTDRVLATDQNIYDNSLSVFVNNNNNNINIKSTTESIKDVIVYDVLGKTLVDKKNINKQELILTELIPTTNVLIVKVILENNKIVIKKVIY